MRKVYVNQEVCMGCHLCEVYCQLQHGQSKDLIKVFRREKPRPLPRLRLEESGVVSFPVCCQHCTDAPCVQACLTGALARDPVSSEVQVDQGRCIGCWTCLLVCPFGSIRQNTEQKEVLKCDLCPGEAMPACVANCPNEALACLEVPDMSLKTGRKAAITAK